MKKISVLMAIFVVFAIMLAGCGNNETIPDEANTKTEQTLQEPSTTAPKEETATSKEENAGKTTSTDQQTKLSEDNQPKEKPANPEPKTQQPEEKLYSEGMFDGKYVKCALPDKWIAKEEPSQGYATIMLDPAQNAGVSVQAVEDNKDSAQARAEGIANQFGCKIVDVKIGKYSYKRMTTKQKDPKTNNDVVFDYLICVDGTKAYYLATPIFDQPAVQSLIAGFQFK